MMRDPRETRLVVACAAASVGLHAALLVWGPALRDRDPLELPQPLQVVLAPSLAPAAPAPAAPAPVAPEPAPREPERKPPPVRAAPLPRPVPVPRAEPARPTPPTPAPVAPAAPAPPAPAEAAAPTAPASAPAARSAGEPSAAPRSDVAAVAPAVSLPDYKAAYLSNPPPAYPRVSRRNGEEGTVVLRVRVSAAGAAVQVQVERTSGSERLDTAALEAVRGWRFVPARRGAEAVEASVLVPIVFSLSGTS